MRAKIALGMCVEGVVVRRLQGWLGALKVMSVLSCFLWAADQGRCGQSASRSLLRQGLQLTLAGVMCLSCAAMLPAGTAVSSARLPTGSSTGRCAAS
jgi:hypothetical protein